MQKRLMTMTLFGTLALFSQPAFAQQVGQACTTAPTNTPTQQSIIPTEGIIECIPDINGNYFWQPMGAGITRYDATAGCNVAGALRWNGSAIQYCDGVNWQSIGGTTAVVGGCQTDWSSCPAGYRATSYFSPGTYNCCDKCGNPSWKYTVCSQ